MIACLKNEDALSPLLRRNGSNSVRTCLNNCDILVGQGVAVGAAAVLGQGNPHDLPGAEQSVRPVVPNERTGGQTACPTPASAADLVPMAPFRGRGGVAGRGVPFSLPKNSGEGC